MTVKINVTIGLGSELRWEQVDFKTATLHVRRIKRGTPSTHQRRATRAATPSG